MSKKPLFTFILLMPFALANVTMAQETILDTSTFDRSVRPQDDLYLYVNGTWLQNTEIPADKSNFGSFIELADLSQERIRTLIEKTAESEHPKGSDAQKVGDFYKSFMNVELVNEKGMSPLQEQLEKIRSLGSHADVLKYFGTLQKMGVKTPVGFGVTQDDKDSTRYIVVIIQSGTTLPDRDYYLKDDENLVAAREALKTYIEKLFDLAAIENGESAAESILELETKLAEVQWERVMLRQAEKRYNLHSKEMLTELAPKLNWDEFFAETEVAAFEELNVMTPSFFEAVSDIFVETPVEVWRQYLQFHLIDAAAPILSQPFVDAHFELHQKQLSGTPQQKPRWKRAVDAAAGAGAGDFGVMGEVVGKLYVEKYFPPESKARMDQLVKNLLRSFGQSIDDLTWMTYETKQRAKEKLAKINTKIGYTSKWRDYSKLVVEPDDLFGNMLRSQEVEYRRMIEKLGKPVDRDEWGMTPQTVNAYYNPSLNEIVFPAAILQPPFFSAKAPEALNYGGIGAVIGHEISHAFDDQGSKYDGDGNLVNWWTDSDREAFEKLTKQLVAQYEEYEALPGQNVNGKLTLGENIADLSGLAIANKAMNLSFADNPPKVFAGWEPKQLFFVGWSRVWQRKYRDDELSKRLKNDPHSPSQFRANGPVMNIDAFYEAFDLNEDDRLFKPQEERIKIW